MAGQRFRAPVFAPGLMLLCLLIPDVGFSVDPVFFAPRFIAMPGEQIFSLAVADLDGVNGLDVAAVSYEGDSLSVLLNTGETSFDLPRSWWAGDGPTSVISAQLDNDDNIDLVTIAWDDSLRIFLGHGDGEFTPGATYPTADNPWELVSADFNGDQIADLACSHVGDAVFRVWIGDGSGHFNMTEHVTSDRQRGLVVAEMDGVAGPDLVLAIFAADQLAIHLNNGAGGFMPAIAYTTADKPYDLSAVDLSGNGLDDILLIHKDAERSIWGIPAIGMGYLGPPIIFNSDRDMDQSVLADLDDDGDLDLLVTSVVTNSVGILIQPEPGEEWQSPFFQDGGSGAYAPAAGDFDNDGDVDVLVSSYWSNQIALLDNRTYFVPVSVSDFRAESTPGRVDLQWWGESDGAPYDFRVLVAAPGSDFGRTLELEEIHSGRWRAVDDAPELWVGGDFRYRLLSREGDGDWLPQRLITVHVPAAAPAAPMLLEPWPNPANPRVSLGFLLPEAGPVELSVYDLRGRRVARIAAGEFEVGRHEFDWDGGGQSSGVYLVGLMSRAGIESRRLILLR